MSIGIIGAGGVARYAHLPAYRALGLDVGALCDLDAGVLRQVGADYDVPITTRDPLELITHDAVSVIDLATPPGSHLELMEMAAKHRKPVLVQKPLCFTRQDFAGIRELESTGARVRMNLSGRHVSAWMKVAQLIKSEEFGRPLLCTFSNRDWWDRQPGRWDHGIDQYIVFEMVIHHLDLCLFWFGPPRRLTARTGSHPRQRLQRANFATVTLEYESGLIVQIIDDWTMNEYAFAAGHPFEDVIITGENGVIRASSERVEWSPLNDNNIAVWHRPRPGQRLTSEELSFNWFPDSFGQSMRCFMEDLSKERKMREDWRHLVDLTELTFLVAESAASDEWVSFRPCPY